MKNNRLLNIVLSVCLIIGVIFAVQYVIGEFFFTSDDEVISTDSETFIDDEITSLSVDLLTADFVIKTGDKASVSTDSGFIKYSLRKGKLDIDEKTHSIKNSGGTVVLTLSENCHLTKCKINTGKGNISADILSSSDCRIDYGAGNVEIGVLFVDTTLKINGGAGKITVSDGKINNSHIDVGVGNLNVRTAATGRMRVECGIGKTDISLLGGEDLYSFKIDKGIGEVVIGDESVGDGSFGFGGNLIDIDGGVGNINVSFE